MRRTISLAVFLLALSAATAVAKDRNAPTTGQRTITVRVHDTTMRAKTAPIESRALITSIAFYVDGKLAPANGVGSTNCRRDYTTTRGVVIRVDGCGKGNAPLNIAVANVGRHAHRVTIRVRFVL